MRAMVRVINKNQVSADGMEYLFATALPTLETKMMATNWGSLDVEKKMNYVKIDAVST